MAPMLTPTKKARIYQLHRAGWEPEDIANEVNVSVPSVYRHRDNNDFYRPRRPGPGRPRRLNDDDLEAMASGFDSGELHDAADAKRTLFGARDISFSAVRRNAAEIGYKGRVRRTKPLILLRHAEARLAWAESFLSHTRRTTRVVEDFRKWTFSDESRFELFKSGGSRYCRRLSNTEYDPNNVRKVVKHGGGSIMVWGFIDWQRGTGRLYRIDGHLTAEKYIKILEDAYLPGLAEHGLDVSEVRFQQDGDPKHRAGRTKRWFKEHKLDLLSWPANSPDMSIIEPVWDILDGRVRARNPLPRNRDELWHALQEEWANISLKEIRNLYDSMPRRILALYKASGWYTGY